MASAGGLDGIAIGRPAEELELGKSGVHKHFGTKETLQVSTPDTAFVGFWHRVVEPTLTELPGRRAAGQSSRRGCKLPGLRASAAAAAARGA
ncbi:hypothetical protein [Crossiella cryophila]|uniref:Uncharacterized protein n=1 Tax=Crossiella cryophila TaxID=43355 RepID=A0A7W7FW10_9PSEU|nr:hypothetical protein [Crossiella cryophila]MBB4679088.1 hypothetical protein [Crossiella cryophila]